MDNIARPAFNNRLDPFKQIITGPDHRVQCAFCGLFGGATQGGIDEMHPLLSHGIGNARG